MEIRSSGGCYGPAADDGCHFGCQSLGEYVWHRGTFGIGVYLDCAADACGGMGTGAVV